MRPRSSTLTVLAALTVLTLTLTACGAQAGPANVSPYGQPPAATQAPPPTQAPAVQAPATAMPPATQDTSSGGAYGGGGYGNGYGQGSSPTEAPAAGQGVPNTGAAQVAVGQSAQLGAILVDSKGMTLYLLTKDTPNTSTCYGQCASNWPPLTISGQPVAGQGLDASKLGTTQRTDGSTQLTYNGWPLYYFIKDKQPGDVTGQGVGSVWYVISTSGDPVK